MCLDSLIRLTKLMLEYVPFTFAWLVSPLSSNAVAVEVEKLSWSL